MKHQILEYCVKETEELDFALKGFEVWKELKFGKVKN